MPNRRVILVTVGVVVIIALLIGGVAALRRNQQSGAPVVLGLVPPTPAPDNLARAVAPIAQALAGQLGRQVVPRVYPSYGHLIDAIGRGECDMAVLTPFAYAAASLRYGAQVVLSGGRSSGDAPEYEFLARAGSPATVPAQLRGLRLAVPAAAGPLTDTYLRTFLLRFGLVDGESIRLVPVADEQTALNDLLAGTVDVAAVSRGLRDQLRAAQPTLDAQVQVVWIAERIAYEAVTVAPSARVSPAEVSRAWQAIVTQADTSGAPVFRNALRTLFGFEGLSVAVDPDYAAAREAVAALGMKFR